MKTKKLAWIFCAAAAIGLGCLVFRFKMASDNKKDSPPPTPDHTTQALCVTSFNIQFLGNSAQRDNQALVNVLRNSDIVVMEELVAPPYPGLYPDGTPFKPDPQATTFFNDMSQAGFKYILSEENTGKTLAIHHNGSSAEWFVSFYKPGIVEPANDLPHGFLAEQRAHNPDYERVPYAFPFRSEDKSVDFVLIAVHLQPNPGGGAQRQHEMQTITTWIHQHDSQEKDFIILGDMNVQNRKELLRLLPSGYESLNDACVPTNTDIKSPKPYDQVMYNQQYTGSDTDQDYGFHVLNLINLMRDSWATINQGPYPGTPYNHNQFRKIYSDHNPVTFKIKLGFDLD
jgi:hypothetical protein